jgi:hypothetical protein
VIGHRHRRGPRIDSRPDHGCSFRRHPSRRPTILGNILGNNCRRVQLIDTFSLPLLREIRHVKSVPAIAPDTEGHVSRAAARVDHEGQNWLAPCSL